MKPIILDVCGAPLFCITTDRFKSEYFSLRFSTPLCAEWAQHHALLTLVLGRGTARHPSKLELNRYLDELYSTSVASSNRRMGDMQWIGFSADFLGDRYVSGENGILFDVIAVMAEIMLHPTLENGMFRSDYVENEKSNLRDSIRAAINNPRGYAMSKCRALLCAGEPYALSLIGEEETVSDISVSSLTACHRRLVEGVIPTFLYVGATPPAEVAALIRAHFPVFTGQRPAYRTLVKAQEGEASSVVEEAPLCQGKLSIGFRTDISMGHRLAPALAVLNEIYGGSPASKLFLNVRERRSLCYHCSSIADLYKGVLFANAGMTPEHRGITEEAMLEELAAISAGHISDVEFEAAHRSLRHASRLLYDNPGALSGFYAGRALIGSSETVDDFRNAVARVTKEDVVEAAAHIQKGATFFLKGTLQGEEDEE